MIFGEHTTNGDIVLMQLVTMLFDGNYEKSHDCDPGCPINPVSVACDMSAILHYYKHSLKRKMNVDDYADAFMQALNDCVPLVDHERMAFMCGIYVLQSTSLEDLYPIVPLVTTKLQHTTMPKHFKGYNTENPADHVHYKLICEAHWQSPSQMAG